MTAAKLQALPRPAPGRRTFFVHCARRGALLGITALAPAAFAQSGVRLDVPYVPTPPEVVNRMLKMADIKPSDFVMDVGCGDGRMVVAAARIYKVHGLGVDINPERIEEAKRNAAQAGVADKVEFRIGNLYDTDLSPADVLVMYLLPRINLELRPKILATTKPGTRIVSHAFSMGDWRPDELETVDGTTIYLWVVPAKVDGHWKVRQAGSGDSFDLALKQSYQDFAGTATLNGRTVPVREGRLRGADISFVIDTEPGRSQTFRGRVNGQAIEVSNENGPAWLATRGQP